MLLHGSTVATNAVLEHKFDGLGLIVTRGFRHMIEIARQSVPDGYGNSFFWVKPPRLVPLHLVREVPGRLRFDGSEIEPVDEEATLAAVRELVEDGVRCIAVCLLHSYANGAHEQAVGELIRREFPRRLRLALLGRAPRVSRIRAGDDDAGRRAGQALLQDLSAKRRGQDPRQRSGDIPFLIMQSNGGVVKHSTAGERPVTMLLSGPAAGILGSIHMATLAGYKNILTIDVGGTSTDVAIIEDLQADVHLGFAGRELPGEDADARHRHRRLGRRVDRLDRRLRPASRSGRRAPAPIPARSAIGSGGTQPTVTDAAIVLGRLPAALIGGEIKLDLEVGARGLRRARPDCSA